MNLLRNGRRENFRNFSMWALVYVCGQFPQLDPAGNPFLPSLQSALVTGTIASAFSWYSVASDPWTTEACWASAMVMARTAISLASQQTIGLSRLCSCEDGWLKVRHLLGKSNPDYGESLRQHHRHSQCRVKMKTSQLWMWQTPVMLANIAILLFVIGLMIAIFARAVQSQGDWTKGRNQVTQPPSAAHRLEERGKS